MNWLTATRWSPYLVGAGIGVLSWFTFLISSKALGCSTSFARTAGMIERIFRGEQVTRKPYYQKVRPTIDWQWMLVLGIVVGAFVSSQLSGSFELRWIPDRWEMAFGSAAWSRLVVALIGGVLIGFGARWAGGCTSGHGISGALQLSVGSWIALLGFFVGGAITAMLLFYL